MQWITADFNAFDTPQIHQYARRGMIVQPSVQATAKQSAPDNPSTIGARVSKRYASKP
jgi:hypothetical protein